MTEKEARAIKLFRENYPKTHFMVAAKPERIITCINLEMNARALEFIFAIAGTAMVYERTIFFQYFGFYRSNPELTHFLVVGFRRLYSAVGY